MLFEENNQNLGDCIVSGRLANNQNRASRIVVNNFQEEKSMNKNDCLIRLETPADYAEVENLVREAFWNVYRPGCLEHYVLHTLRDNDDFVP